MTRTSFRQWFYAFTGDRKREAAALAQDAVNTYAPGADTAATKPSEDLLAAAEHSVRAAHGDLGIEATRESTHTAAAVGDIAVVDDISQGELLVADTVESGTVESGPVESGTVESEPVEPENVKSV